LDEIWSILTEYIVAGWPWQILGAIRAVATDDIFLSGKQRTISPISRQAQPNFTNFTHVDRCGDENFPNKNFENFLP